MGETKIPTFIKKPNAIIDKSNNMQTLEAGKRSEGL
jgi:hypothetical protein